MKRTGLIGYPLGHSLSPKIHGYWIKQYGLNASYELFEVAPERLGEKVAQLKAEGVAGFNVTVPHKERILAFIEEKDLIVQQIGATNTVFSVDSEDKFCCTNTDAYGFITNLKMQVGDLAPYLGHVLVLGAGGAARAAVVALKNAGAGRIDITNRTRTTADHLASEFMLDSVDWEQKERALKEVTLLVNTTSLGMRGKEPLTLSLDALPKEAAVHDIVYAPLETPLLAAARARGNQVVDGLGMLLYQAQAAFAHWHGITPEVTDELRAHILAP